MKTKKTALLFCLILSGSTCLFSQGKADTNSNGIFVTVQKEPEFPGGDAALVKWLGDNTKYPNEAKKNNSEGTVWVTFVVEKDGAVSNVQLLRGVSTDLDNEALRVVNLMPKWTPGQQNGRNVRVRYRVPMKFELTPKQSGNQKN